MALKDKIDRAAAALRAGDLKRAGRDLRQLLQKHPRDADVLHLLGVVELKSGQPAKAVVLIERALAQDATPAFFHNNHGEALRAVGRPEDALAAFDRALASRRDYPEAHCGRGSALRDLGRATEARRAYESALAFRPGWPPALTNLGALLSDVDAQAALDIYLQVDAVAPSPDLDHRIGTALCALGRWEEGASRMCRAAHQAPGVLDYRRSLVGALQGQHIGNPSPMIIELVTELLADRRLDTKSLIVTALSLLEAGGEPLLTALLNAQLVPDPGVQARVAELRDQMVAQPGSVRPALAAAVATQCFATDYVADPPPPEALGALRRSIEEASPSSELEPLVIAFAACDQLTTLASAEALAAWEGWSDVARPVVDLTLREPLAELEIRAGLAVLTEIDDSVSEAVQSHYEVHPYPRWRWCPAQPSGSLGAYLGKRGFEAPPGWPERPRVLVAGCGTGQQPIELALTFPETSILAVDLSRTSLAYATRMAWEHGVAEQIGFALADLLRLGDLDERFDLVESVGVLHHTADPLASWRVLRGLLKPGGAMRIGLYSETARRPIVRARELIAERGWSPVPEDIRAFRKAATDDPAFEEIRGLTLKRDFHNLSMCRDLCFHEHEQRYDIPRLRRELDELGLRFLGFEFLARSQFERFVEAYGRERWTDLDAWEAFEEENPDTFFGMYQFYCQAVD